MRLQAACKCNREVHDHNTGRSLHRQLRQFRKRQSPASRKFFLALVKDPRVARLMQQISELILQESKERGERRAFDQLRRMQSREFAREQAQLLSDLLPNMMSRAMMSRARRLATLQ